MAQYSKQAQFKMFYFLHSWIKNKGKCGFRYFQSHDSKLIPTCLTAQQHGERIALTDVNGEHTYNSLYERSRILGNVINNFIKIPTKPSTQCRIAMLCPNDASYLITQWACWLSGHIVVPLHAKYPSSLLEYFINDSEANLIIVTPDLKEKIDNLNKKSAQVLVLDDDIFEKNSSSSNSVLPSDFYSDASAIILYTSGTTGSPKGVVLTHKNIKSNVSNMISSWRWSKNDRILHCLPLHHTHGILNALVCPLEVGAECIMLPKFDASEVWQKLLSIDVNKRITVFMGVPTMYIKLIEEYDKSYEGTHKTKEFIKAFCKQKIRLMVSGSSALPVPVFKRWEEITGHQLLERYGMTEIGMALTNPYDGPRHPGYVGNPFESVQVRLIKKNFYTSLGYNVIVESSSKRTTVVSGKEKEEGELLVKGPTIFKEYWNRESATAEAFTKDSWFKTGDTAVYVNGMFKIQGRTSVDIIKSGGYKISALEVEHHLLSHPKITDCAVVGVTDVVWGQKVAAVIVTKNEQELTLAIIKEWCEDKMAPYQIPTVLKIVEEIPRNTLGKVNKVQLVKQMFPSML